MTVQELYEYAKQRGIVDYEIRVQYRDYKGMYGSTDPVDSVLIENDLKELIL